MVVVSSSRCVFNSGVDPAADGLKLTTRSGDIDTSKVLKADANGCVTGASGSLVSYTGLGGVQSRRSKPPPPPILPHHESMSIAGVLNFEKMERFTNMMWPQGNPRVSKTIHSYAKQVVELDQLLRRMIFESMGVKKYYDEHIESNFYRFRVAKYTIPDQPDELNETKMGCRANTDMNLVTILSENQVQGLEITTKDGQGVQARVSPKMIQTQPKIIWLNICWLLKYYFINTAKNDEWEINQGMLSGSGTCIDRVIAKFLWLFLAIQTHAASISRRKGFG
ncbi:hypothetical protein IFM89_000022 [Coptis chinensis]|uniref:Uncharacterized protein n=1 Tax=Coptis chinensis TaxID=261450 RepID=A0A835MBV8_9MAGN|nr:hypothetical protein IFM89_000022 [Coptis chinensis]